jgi:hypothetical protein
MSICNRIIAAIFAALVVWPWVASADGGDTTIIHACINDSSGTIQIVGANDDCGNNWTPLHWGIQSSPGPQGEQGPAGPPGSCGSGTGFTEDGCGTESPFISGHAVTPFNPVVGTVIRVDLAGADPDNDPAGSNCGQLTVIKSEFVSLPPLSAAKLIPSVGFTPAFVPDVDGEYIVRTTVTDSTGRSGSIDITIIVTP